MLQGVHKHGYVHNDIKMDNISVDETDDGLSVTLLDMAFVAKIGDPLNSTLKILQNKEPTIRSDMRRKYYWYAPEYFESGAVATTQADVYSVCCLIKKVFTYMMVTPEDRVGLLDTGLHHNPYRRPELWRLRYFLQKEIRRRREIDRYKPSA